MVGYIKIFILSIFAICLQLLRRAKGSNLSVSETGVAGDDSLVYGGAFREELLLVHPDATVESLGAIEAVQYHGITVDASSGDVYVTNSKSVLRLARGESSESSTWQTTTVIRGWTAVRVDGYNLGGSYEDVVYFSVKGVECSNMRWESSTTLICVSGDPLITADLGKGINASHVVVQTAAGGWTEGGYPGDFVSTELADHSLKPIITRVESYGHSINPRAICFESAKRHLYYSNIGKQSIERVIVTDDTAIVEYDTFLPKIGRVHGMAIDAKEGRCGGFLYFSDAQSGTISRIELNTEGRPSTAAIQVLVSAVNDPMGVALEPNGWRLFFTLSEGSIRAVARDGSDVSASRRTIHNEGGGYEVRRFDSGTRLDGLAISLSDEGGDDPTERRLYWTESGRSPALKRSSLDGTRVETISVMDSAGQNIRPVWPRGVAFGSGPSAGLFYYERLGGVRRLLDPAGGNSEVLLEEDPNPTALAIKALITRTEKRGGKGDSMVFFKSSS